MDMFLTILFFVVVLGLGWVYENLGDDISYYIKTSARKFLRKDEK